MLGAGCWVLGASGGLCTAHSTGTSRKLRIDLVDPSKIHLNLVGTPPALCEVMAGWTSEEEIVAYQRAVELRDQIIELTETGPITKFHRFREQIRDSAASATNNITEGFHRFNHGEFAYLAGVAKASLAETRKHLADGLKRKCFSKKDVQRLDCLAEAALRATAGLIRYLRNTPTPKPDKPKRTNTKRPGQTDTEPTS